MLKFIQNTQNFQRSKKLFYNSSVKIIKIILTIITISIWTKLYPNTNIPSLEDNIKLLEEHTISNIIFFETNSIYPIKFERIKSLKVSFEIDEKQELKKDIFFMPYERRYEIILLVSIPTSYMIAKFLMEQLSFYNYRDNTRSLNTQQWAFVIGSSIIIPLIVATEDYIKYKEFVKTKLKF